MTMTDNPNEWNATLRARIEALTAACKTLGQEVNMAKYGQPDFAWSIHKAAMADLQADNARLRKALTGIKRAASHRMQDDPKDLHNYYFHTADAALSGKEPSHEVS
jgi:hypothetical protein